MTKLQQLLREYQDRRFSQDKDSERFTFETSDERFIFVQRLNEINADYFLYGRNIYNIEVFYEKVNND